MQPFFGPETATERNLRLTLAADRAHRMGLPPRASRLRMTVGSWLVHAGAALIPAPQDLCWGHRQVTLR
jgi:hypothetical protein